MTNLITTPHLSVIVPVRNSSATIKEALASVFAQTFKEFEIIVIDGLSSDGTVSILKTYAGQISWLSERDSGTSDAINKGIRRARGKYITTLLADDNFADPNVFERAMELLRANPSVDMLFATVRRIDPSGMAPTREFPSDVTELHRRTALHLPGAFFKKSALGQDELNLEYKLANDYEFVCRLLFGRKLKAMVTPDVYMVMRLGGMSGATQNDFRSSYEKFLVRRKYYGAGLAWKFAIGAYIVSGLRALRIRPFTWYRKAKHFISQ